MPAKRRSVRAVAHQTRAPRLSWLIAFGSAVAVVAVAALLGNVAIIGYLVATVMILLSIRQARNLRRPDADAAARLIDPAHLSAERQAADQHARFGMALNHMSQGLAMFDHSNRLLLVNAAVFKVFDLLPGTLRPGMLFTEVLQVVADAGNLSVDVSTVIAFYTKLVAQNVAATFVLKVPSGWHLTATFNPCGDGWLVTYEDVTAVREADERIRHMATHDALTGLPNRVMLKTAIEEAIAGFDASATPGFAVLYLDLDHFKDVNESLGHSTGDRLLCDVADRIQFAIVAFPGEDAGKVAELADRLLNATSAAYDIDGQAIVVGVSIGIAIAPTDGVTADTLMKNADLALYRAKSDGRGRHARFEPVMEQNLVNRRRVEIELRNALVLGELELFYQPIVKVATRRIVGCEALMRWRHSTRGLVSPAEFIPIAEESGLIIQMGEWALNRACLEAARWPAAIKVAVNLSSVQFRSGNLVEVVASALERSGLAAGRLELEITESTMMHDTDATLAIITEIKALGVRIAMDDFGTGYSSLAYLQRFPFDKVKIDQAFVRDIRQATNLAIIGAVTSIAERMGIETTAEGVETEAQFESVAAEGCDQAQGYLFSPPRPAGEIAAMLERETPPAVVGPMMADMAAV